MSVLTQDELYDLRISGGIAPDEDDSRAEVWAPRETVGALGVDYDDAGFPVNAATTEAPNENLVFLYADYCRVGKVRMGQDKDFGAQTAVVSPWKVSFPWYVPGTADSIETAIPKSCPKDAIIRVQKPLRAAATGYVAGEVMQPAEGVPYYYIAANEGTTAEDAPTFPPPLGGFDAGVWGAARTVTVGDTIREGYLRYRATAAGTTGSSKPTFPTSELGTVDDNGVTWQLCESVLDGEVVWQVAGNLEQFQAVDNTGGKTYGVLFSVLCEKINIS